MRRAAAVDANQASIVADLRKVGCSVYCAHQSGQGFPDLVVAYGMKNHLIEVKDGSKPPSARKLTKPQEKFHAEWKGPIFVVTSTDEALECMGLHHLRGRNG